MVQVLKAAEREPSIGEKLMTAVRGGVQAYGQYQQGQRQNEALKGAGIDSNLPPEFQKMAYEAKLKQGEAGKKLESNKAIISDLEEKRGLEPGSLSAYVNDPKMAEQVSRPKNEPKQALTEKEVPVDITRKIKKVIADNPKASSDELRLAMDEVGIPPVYSNPYTENRRRTEEQASKTSESKIQALRQETLPVRTELAKKAMAAEKGIQNKEQLMNLIEKGDLNDPTYASLAESLPLNLGKRLLSNDTTEYKAGLVEEFGDLRNIFQGQTRNKEIELLENKIADIYLTDDQKKAILRSRLGALKADIILAEAAAELEDREDLGVLQFQKEVERIAKPKMEALFNHILDEQNSIIQNAENRKQIPLDFNDPDDKKIAEAIIKEAGGNRNEARKLAKKKGYSF